jgi:hypothetical protein
VAIQIPRDGLETVLRGWSGDGQIFAALASVSDSSTTVVWSARDVRRRAHRVMLGKLESALKLWPATVQQWAEYLPITVTSQRTITPTIAGPVTWAETVRRFGWPPTQFVSKLRRRTSDEVALTTLAWTAHKLLTALDDIADLSPSLHSRLISPIQTLRCARDEYLADTPAIRPDRIDLISMASSSRPWPSVAYIAKMFTQAETDLGYLAYELIEPDPDLEWRLFHLAVLGHVLLALRGSGARVRWRAPLTARQTSGPQFLVTMREGTTWDLWFEAAGANAHYGNSSLYRNAVRNITNVERSIGADILLVRPGDRALLIECKWSPLGTYIGRDGFHQAAGYALEARAGLAQQVWSFVIGPEEIVPSSSVAFDVLEPASVLIGSASVRNIGSILFAFLANDSKSLA